MVNLEKYGLIATGPFNFNVVDS